MKITATLDKKTVEKEFIGELFRVEQWGDYFYAILNEPKFTAKPQKIQVIDVTESIENGKAVLFCQNCYVEYNLHTHTDKQTYLNSNNDADSNYFNETFTPSVCIAGWDSDGGLLSLVEFYDDEKNIMRGGKYVSIADLPFQIAPPTREYINQVRREQMDELEASVDAGGSIGL